MTDIRIGTSGYDYSEWKDILYPSTVKREDYLSVYSKQFSTLEINYTYYRIPEAHSVESLVQKVNRSMDFAIKTHQSLTHIVNSSTWKESTGAFLNGIEPLLADNRLVAVLIEFPYSFHYAPDNRVYLDMLLKEFKDVPTVVEFRNKEWYIERVFDGLKERGSNLCLVDMPVSVLDQLAINIPVFDLTYIRFHGRNADNWWTGNNVSRYDYLYNKEELSAWAKRLKENERKTKKVRIYFNNHAKGNAVKNALMMKELMELE